jgi:ABC-2 type transport system permease protein
MADPRDRLRRKPLHGNQRHPAGAAVAVAVAADAGSGIPTARERRAGLGGGWVTIAAKELADHLLSVRFVVLLVILVLAAAVPLYFASGRLRDLAPQASGVPALFLALFTVGSQDIPILRVDAFVGFMAPLLGIAFWFDAVNGERSEGTLPRLLSQPIHRDDVINGKFASGLALIGIVLVAMVLLIAGFGIVRLGIAPTGAEVFRIALWLIVTIVYVGFWLAFGTLLSVVFRRAATSALVGFGAWLGVTIFGSLITTVIANVVAPVQSATTLEQALGNAQVQEFIARLLPSTLYDEVSVVLLNPSVTQISTPVTVGQLEQAQQQIPTLLSLDQSVLLVWPHVVVIVALMVVMFALAYVAFMRQEVRA